jgi:hypothetical protein
MIKISLAVVLTCFSYLGQVYFSHSHNPNAFLYQVLCILIIPVCIALGFYGRQDLLDKKKLKDLKNLAPLKEMGEKIIVDMENCNLHDNNFDIPVSSYPMIRTGVPAFGAPISMSDVQLSVVTYQHERQGRIETFTSQVFPIDLISLEVHIMQHHLILYVDKKDRNHYIFELLDTNIQPYEADL